MKLRSSCLFYGFVCIALLTSVSSVAEESSTSTPVLTRVPSRFCTFASLMEDSDCRHNRLQHVGTYTAYGKFAEAPRYQGWYNQAVLEDRTERKTLRPSDVPGWVNLEPLETVVENYQPPARARKPVRGQSKLAAWRDSLITVLYGKEDALLRPTQIATDSKGRLIVCDPAAGAIHVLDGQSGFRISAGPRRWLQVPAGVTVDGEDNIYVSDWERGTVQVYDPQGRFRTEFGRLTEDETLFQRPAAIAFDSGRGNLYLLDPPRNLLLILDREGRIVKRIGRSHCVEFEYPTELAIYGREVLVLDSRGERVQVLDLDGNLLRSFNTGFTYGRSAQRHIGIGVDSEGNIYLSNIRNSEVRKYDSEGRLVAIVGQQGQRPGQFNSPGGLWIDASNRLYIADTMNRRVQVFQLDTAPGNTLRAGTGVGF